MAAFSEYPLCRFDGRCTNPGCTFSHSKPKVSAVAQKQAYGGAKVCSFFLQGRCTAGALCRFSHSVVPAAADAVSPPCPPASAPPPSLAPRVCSFFLQGRCTAGASCRFSHSRPMQAPSEAAPRPLCIYDGRCTNPGCKFWHNLPRNVASPRPPPLEYKETWRSKVASFGDAPLYSIDVECVASSYSHAGRDVGRVVMVDSSSKVVFDATIDMVRDGVDVKSYMTKLTGLTLEGCASGVPLVEALEGLKKVLPKNAVLVGQGIHHDIEWLQLKEGVDFASSFDLAEMFKLRLKDHIHPTTGAQSLRFRKFSLRHTVLALTGVDMQSDDHNPVDDAAYSLRLFNKYKFTTPGHMEAVRVSVSRAPVTASFSQRWVVIDGVMMGKDSYRVVWKARAIWRWWKRVQKS